MLKEGVMPDIPKIDNLWLYRWKLQYGISLRKPNRRFKLSRGGLKLRLRIFWMNNIRVRHYCKKLFGVDPGQHCDNADLKGWHKNQGGSNMKAQ